MRGTVQSPTQNVALLPSNKNRGNGPPMRRTASMCLSDNILEDTYKMLFAEDPGIAVEAICAFREMQFVPFDDLDDMRNEQDTEGLVQRRAPKNPLRSPLMGKFRKGKKDKKDKVSDPALQKNPLRGRLLITFMTTSALLLIFLQSLCFNKFQTGKFHAPKSSNGMFGPEPLTLFELGGLNSNEVRKGELYRLFWAMWMHSGWLHIVFNIVCQLQYMWMVEPDWGSVRTFVLFLIAGITGNLLSAICDPCSTTVGSSGALFGLMGGMLPYCIEYWKSIPRPGLILVFSMVVLLISVLTGFTGNTDNWAHMGGMVGGVLFGLGTIRTLTAFEDMDCCKSSTDFHHRQIDSTVEGTIIGPDRKQRKKVVKRNPVVRLLQKKIRPSCKCGLREWIVRGTALILLVVCWIILFHKLLVSYEFQPAGHVTYSRIRQCCCCYYDTSTRKGSLLNRGETWTCNYCDAPLLNGKGTWESKCGARTAVKTAEKELSNVLDLILQADTIGEDSVSGSLRFLARGFDVSEEENNSIDASKDFTPTEFESVNETKCRALSRWSEKLKALERLKTHRLLSKDVQLKVEGLVKMLESSKPRKIDAKITKQLDGAITHLILSINKYITNDFSNKIDNRLTHQSSINIPHINNTTSVFIIPLTEGVSGSLVGEEGDVFNSWESIYHLWKKHRKNEH